jgi:O-acetyl-ADP-ribose deacetylase (regulator of RNase III)
MKHIKLRQGDITLAKDDAIVNAANPQMLGGGGVDGAIHAAAGPGLLAACREVDVVDGIRCPFGEARITPAGQLSCKYIIHTVGPIYANEQDPAAVLQSAYRNSLSLALQHHCLSIAFPAISCGVYGYPIDDAAAIALAVCSEEQYSQLEISFYLFSSDVYRVWQVAYKRLADSVN